MTMGDIHLSAVRRLHIPGHVCSRGHKGTQEQRTGSAPTQDICTARNVTCPTSAFHHQHIPPPPTHPRPLRDETQIHVFGDIDAVSFALSEATSLNLVFTAVADSLRH
ncbi:hypothetical protein WMY93_025675 [Mugilogobius chulae]|uniref:Uncharacterized protein n=1 Tax=Mugilogobius chulae TaxID=88201 RepID=A0AAW0MYU2_9GOBI